MSTGVRGLFLKSPFILCDFA
uniref:Calcium-binding protein n=1 Tax=Rhizophora mucronata TaxID=61149 RepID=A0A2P2MFQ3_RHIMU